MKLQYQPVKKGKKRQFLRRWKRKTFLIINLLKKSKSYANYNRNLEDYKINEFLNFLNLKF